MENGDRNGKKFRSPTPGSEIWSRVPKRSDRREREEDRNEEDGESDETGGPEATQVRSKSADGVRLRVLGGALLEMNGNPVTGRAARPYNLALLTYLAASPGRTASRDKLVACFWPRKKTSRARHRLSVALHVLRQELGEDAVVPTGDSLTLSRDRIWTDLGEFRRAVREGRLEEAVDLHSGPLLDGFHLSGARAFEGWVEDERLSTKSLYRSALNTLIRESEEAEQPRRAIRWYEELVSTEPFCARVTMAFMRTLAGVGQVERAIARARAYATLVEAKLGIPPDPEVMALARDLVEEREPGSLRPRLWGAG